MQDADYNMWDHGLHTTERPAQAAVTLQESLRGFHVEISIHVGIKFEILKTTQLFEFRVTSEGLEYSSRSIDHQHFICKG